MKKKLIVILILFVMFATSILSIIQPLQDLAKNDGVIEWHSYKEEKVLF